MAKSFAIFCLLALHGNLSHQRRSCRRASRTLRTSSPGSLGFCKYALRSRMASGAPSEASPDRKQHPHFGSELKQTLCYSVLTESYNTALLRRRTEVLPASQGTVSRMLHTERAQRSIEHRAVPRVPPRPMYSTSPGRWRKPLAPTDAALLRLCGTAHSRYRHARTRRLVRRCVHPETS